MSTLSPSSILDVCYCTRMTEVSTHNAESSQEDQDRVLSMHDTKDQGTYCFKVLKVLPETKESTG